MVLPQRTVGWLVVLVTGGLVVSACGGSGNSSEGEGAATPSGAVSADDPLVRAIADDVHADPDAPFDSRDSAERFAGDIVGSIGEDRLAELGFTVLEIPDEFQVDWTTEEVDTIIASIDRCVDVAAAAGSSLPVELSEAEQDCVLCELGDDFYLESLRPNSRLVGTRRSGTHTVRRWRRSSSQPCGRVVWGLVRLAEMSRPGRQRWQSWG